MILMDELDPHGYAHKYHDCCLPKEIYLPLAWVVTYD